MPTQVEMRAQRNSLWTQARDILEAPEGLGSAENKARYDKIIADMDKVDADLNASLGLESRKAKWDDSKETPLAKRSGPTVETATEPTKEQRSIFHDTAVVTSRETREAWKGWLRGGTIAPELRNLQMDSDPAGGYLVPPQEFITDYIIQVDDLVFVRKAATKYTVARAESLGIPVIDQNPADSDWTSELLTGSADTTLSAAKRELRPHPLAKSIRVSKKLLRASPIDVEALVRDRFAYKFAVTEEKAFLTGTGAQQPLGLFTQSSVGISTARDTITSSSSGNVTADNLLETKFGLKAVYWPRSQWILHRAKLKQVRELKDGNNNYIWSPGGFGYPANALSGGNPDTILGHSYYISEYAPSSTASSTAVTSNNYNAILGDYSRYVIVDALNFDIQRLVELFAATNQDGFIMRQELDGMPVLEEAFSRSRLST